VNKYEYEFGDIDFGYPIQVITDDSTDQNESGKD